MKITFFDVAAIGKDLDLSPITSLGEATIYENTQADEIKARISATEVAVINKIKITKEVLDSAPNLKIICVAATGFDNIDTEYCRKKNIAVTNVPNYSTNSVALVTVSIALSLMTHLGEFRDFVSNGEYTKSGLANRLAPAFNDLYGKTWGIVGYGNIGKKVAEVASAFGCKVIYNKASAVADKNYRSIDELCRESDIITLHCPLNQKTEGLIGEKQLSVMKNSAILVNVARGAVCDETAVANAVKQGKLAAFGCDVYSAEPFGDTHPFNKIKDLPNVILTPHIAWASFEARTKVINEMAENIKAFTSGKIRNRVEL